MKKIMVVDNDKFILEFMNDVLSERGHEVLTAEGGLSAVDILKTYTPDIIFVDLVMPDIDGKQLCKIIRSMPELKDVRIVILSAIAAEEDLKIKEFRADALIAKGPVNDMAKQVVAIVDRLGLTPTKGLPGETIGVQGLFPRNITKELLSIKNHFEIILGKISEGVLEVTSEGRIVYTNSIALSIIGIPEEKLLGSHFIDLFSADDRHRVAELAESSGDKPQKTIGEFFFGLNGRKVTLQFLPIVEYSATSLVIINDITGRLQAQEELQEERNKLQSIVGAIGDGLSIQDLDYNISYQNDVLKDLFGDRVGEKCYLVYEGKDMVCDGCPVEMAYKDGNSHSSERSVIMPSGGITFWENIANPIRDAGGEIISCLEIARNITDRKQAEEEKRHLESQLQQSQKMETVGTLAGGIAHDFNNLLMGIQGRASLLSFDLEPSHPHWEHVNAIEEYIRSATSLTKQLLGFARGGKYEVNPVDMNELVQSSSAMFGRTKKEIRIHTKCQASPLVVDADRGQIEQVLLNMYINAWQAMPPDGGHLYLETKIVTLDEVNCKPHQVDPGRYIKISITDTGVGMDEATRLRIFDPFYTTKEMGRGTGLGLASAYGIIKNHGGMITVYSEIGHGTTFNIYLPVSDKEAHREVPIERGIIKGSATILLVDDEELIIDVGQAMLERLGYRVIVCSGGQEAVKVITDMGNEIDMVIVDMIMPGMDGGTTFDRIREIQPDMPVILSSGYAINGHADKIMRRGCNGFIQKPYNISDLSQKISKVLDEAKCTDRGYVIRWVNFH